MLLVRRLSLLMLRNIAHRTMKTTPAATAMTPMLPHVNMSLVQHRARVGFRGPHEQLLCLGDSSGMSGSVRFSGFCPRDVCHIEGCLSHDMERKSSGIMRPRALNNTIGLQTRQWQRQLVGRCRPLGSGVLQPCCCQGCNPKDVCR